MHRFNFPRQAAVLVTAATATGCAHIRICYSLPPSSAAREAQHDCRPSVLPESVRFSIVKSEQFSIDIDRDHLTLVLEAAGAVTAAALHNRKRKKKGPPTA